MKHNNSFFFLLVWNNGLNSFEYVNIDPADWYVKNHSPKLIYSLHTATDIIH